MVCVVFFFKQKTAYEMRISDWSSDVCSSDLLRLLALAGDVRLLLGLVLELADIEELAHGRIGAGRNLHQVEPRFGGLLDRLPRVHPPPVFALLVDPPPLRHGDEFIVTRTIDRKSVV